MKLDLHPTTSRIVGIFQDKPPGFVMQRLELTKNFNASWQEIDRYFRSAKRILWREHDKLIQLTTPRGTGPIVVCTAAQRVAVVSRNVRKTKVGTRRSLKVSASIDSAELEPNERITHEVNSYLLSTTHDLHRTATQRRISEKVASGAELKPSAALLKFLAS